MEKMAAPTIRNTLYDQNGDVRYHVMAYREISRQELLFAVNAYLAKKGKRRPKRGSEVTIITIIGHE